MRSFKNAGGAGVNFFWSPAFVSNGRALRDPASRGIGEVVAWSWSKKFHSVNGESWPMRPALCNPTITLFNWTFVSFLMHDCIVLSNETRPHCLETFNTLVFLGDLVVVDLWRCSCLFHFTDSAIPNSKDVAMIRICAWCQQEGHQGNQEQMPESSLGLISHGICQYHALGLQRTYRPSLLRQPISTSSHRSSSTSSRIFQ